MPGGGLALPLAEAARPRYCPANKERGAAGPDLCPTRRRDPQALNCPSRPRVGANGHSSQYLRREAPPCGAAPAAPRLATASYCDHSLSRHLARQLLRSQASSTPEPRL